LTAKGELVSAPLVAGDPFRTDPTSVSMGQLVSRVAHLVTRSVERVLGPAGIGLAQWRILELLTDGEGHAMIEIAGHAMVPPPTLTKVVDRMVASALVYRRPDEIDRRRVLVFLSDHGWDLHRELAPQVTRAESDVTAALTDLDFTHLTRLLRRLAG
jgi:DNA-binding MarR family transcriptional regulator